MSSFLLEMLFLLIWTFECTQSIIIANITQQYMNGIIQCPETEDCTVLCLNEESCRNTNISCPINHHCNILCSNIDSCNSVSIYGPMDHDHSLTINCSSTASCKDASIYTQDASIFTIYSCAKPNSCIDISLWIPSNATFYLSNDNSFGGDIYAINGLLDVFFVQHGQVNHEVAIHCHINYNSSCTLIKNITEWQCDPMGDDTCNNPFNYQSTSPSDGQVETTIMFPVSTNTLMPDPSESESDETSVLILLIVGIFILCFIVTVCLDRHYKKRRKNDDEKRKQIQMNQRDLKDAKPIKEKNAFVVSGNPRKNTNKSDEGQNIVPVNRKMHSKNDFEIVDDNETTTGNTINGYGTITGNIVINNMNVNHDTEIDTGDTTNGNTARNSMNTNGFYAAVDTDVGNDGKDIDTAGFIS